MSPAQLAPTPKKKRAHKRHLRLQRRQALARLAYTVEEMSEVTSLSKAHLYLLMADGKLAFAQLGGTRRIPASELVRLGLTV